MHAERAPPCALAAAVAASDVLVTAHGFLTMAMLFLRPGALVFELFPPRYWKPGYAPLAPELGLRHDYAVTPFRTRRAAALLGAVATPFCMRFFACRVLARADDIVADDAALARVVRSARRANASAPPRRQLRRRRASRRPPRAR